MKYDRKYYEASLAGLKTERSHLDPEYMDIQRNIAVDTGDFYDPKSNKTKRNDPYYKHNINNRARGYSKLLASLLVTYMTPPKNRWFDYMLQNNRKLTYEEDVWLRKCEDITYTHLYHSKFYQVMHNLFYEAAVYGCGAIMMKADNKNGFMFSPLTVGQYWIIEDENGDVIGLYRRFALTLRNIIKAWGYDSLPKNLKDRADNGHLEELHTVMHAVEENANYLPALENSYNKPFVSAYWIDGSNTGEEKGSDFLEQKGMTRFPYIIQRWDRYGVNKYGTGIGREVLGDVKMLQSYERDLAKASKKKISPPLKGHPSLKKQEKNVGADGITYTSQPEGFTSLFNVNYDTQQAIANINRIEERLAGSFHIDAFFAMMTANKTMSATESANRKEEKVAMLGSVIDRAHTEALPKVIEDSFSMLSEGNFYPIPPASIQEENIDINYKSLLAQSMEMTDLSLLERWLQVNNALAATNAEAARIPKILKISEYFASKLGVDRELLHTESEIKQMAQADEALAQQRLEESSSKANLNNAKATQAISQSTTTGEQALQEMMGQV